MSLHDDMGHLGIDQTLGLFEDRFFWPKMSKNVRTHTCSCDRCTRVKQQPEKAEMVIIEITYPLELIHMDFLTIEKVDSDKMVHILIVTRHFMKYAQAYVTPNQTAPVVAKMIWENFLVHNGWPTNILMDQGKTFESKLIKELYVLAQVNKLHTTLYQPESNCACEHFNSILINMLETMPRENKKNCQDWVSTMAHAYNCTVSNATGFKPYFLMYGRCKAINRY